ncbi:MAG: hypothetical protein H0T78_02690 [Longispora sp.]|nr:hypothetical protein [Longispora sp. (in: high G+C Gram-positive bacteria)]
MPLTRKVAAILKWQESVFPTREVEMDVQPNEIQEVGYIVKLQGFGDQESRYVLCSAPDPDRTESGILLNTMQMPQGGDDPAEEFVGERVLVTGTRLDLDTVEELDLTGDDELPVGQLKSIFMATGIYRHT